MSLLRLFDVSQYIYAGASYSAKMSNGICKVDGYWRSYDMPSGGIATLLNTVYEFENKNTELVFCVDSVPTYKRELYERAFKEPGYKAGRPKKPDSIKIQCTMAAEILEQMGYNVIRIEGFEADDVIASLVHYYKEDYERVYIHSRDSDLYYLVCENVEIAPVNKAGKIITMSNWERAVKSGYVTPYDTITINFMIHGNKHNNIPAVSADMAKRIVGYIPKELYKKCGNHFLLRKWIESATQGEERVRSIMELNMPHIFDFKSVELHVTHADMELYEFYGIVSGNRHFKKYPVAIKNELGEETVKRYIELYNDH